MNWRTLSPITYDRWAATIREANGPVGLATRAAYDAAGSLSGLCLAQLAEESRYGTRHNRNTPDTLNPLNLRPRGGDGYQRFATYADGIAEWRARLLDPSYAYAGVDDLAAMIAVFAPKTDSNDPAAYAAHVMSRLIAWGVKETAMPDITYGRVPHPPCLKRPIDKREGAGMNDLGWRTVKGVTYHRILGSLWGTDTYFRRTDINALTDYGVGVLAQDGAEHDGEILSWNDPLGRQSGWASGTYSAAHAYGDGAAFVNKYGVDAINRDRASIEISGFQDTPLSEKSRQAIAELTAYWADQAEIPWDQFPIVPGDGFSFICWHEEFGPDFGQKKCPFAVVKAETPALIERTRAILKAAQTGGSKPPAPAPRKPSVPWARDAVGVQQLGESKALAFFGSATNKRKKPLPIRVAADPDAEIIYRVAPNEEVIVRGSVRTARNRYALVEIPGKPELGVGRTLLSALSGPWPVL